MNKDGNLNSISQDDREIYSFKISGVSINNPMAQIAFLVSFTYSSSSIYAVQWIN